MIFGLFIKLRINLNFKKIFILTKILINQIFFSKTQILIALSFMIPEEYNYTNFYNIILRTEKNYLKDVLNETEAKLKCFSLSNSFVLRQMLFEK